QVLSASPVLTEDGTSLPALSVTCFGHFAVKRSGKPVVLCHSRNGQSILRYLIASHGHQATSDILQALLWPEDQPEVAQRKLHIAISVLRRSLNDGISCTPGYILCKNGVYCLNPTATIQTDVEEFLRYYQAGQEKSQERVYFYEKACCLYTGPFLPEDRYADWSFFQREQLSQTYLVMCRTLANHYFMCKRYEDAARWATAVLKEDRCDEIAHRQLIQIYAAQGRRSEALQQYQHCERLLREELGIEPLAETLHILQAVLAGTEVFQNKVET
ncbi:MAG: hypothetical protein J2P37_09465, partial [Ktedonobacteraceae bacterium]|nr:hypothetical protein [Ktedonobacteraceae bacterium]